MVAVKNPISIITDTGFQLSISIDRKTKDYFKYRRNHGIMYIFHDNEDIVDDFFNRHNRPSAQYRKEILPTVRKALQMSDTIKFAWSQKAGCKCPCSPGFLITDPEYKYTDFIICVDVKGIQKPDNRTEALEYFNDRVWGFTQLEDKDNRNE